MQALSRFQQSDFAATARDAWGWWTGELAQMVPARLKPDSARVARADIRLGRSSVEIERVAGGTGQRLVDPRRIEDLDEEGWRELAALIDKTRARILLDPPDCLITSLSLPKAARKRLRSAVALQLSQISPIEPALLRWSMRQSEIGASDITVSVAMAREARIYDLQALFEANGLEAPPIEVETPEGALRLANGHDGSRMQVNASDRRAWLFAALLLATIPFTTVLGALALKASNESKAAAIQKEIAPKVAAEREARRAETLRRALRPLFAKPSVSETLEDLAARLPVTAYVRDLEQGSDRALELTIDTGDLETIEPVLAESPLLPELALSDEVDGDDGRIVARFRTAPR